jgi:Mn2+/Fe2+ NRAMP family transporter
MKLFAPTELTSLVVDDGNSSGGRGARKQQQSKQPPYKFVFRIGRLARFMGPGWVMSLAYLDPGNLEADLQQGAYTNMSVSQVLVLVLTEASVVKWQNMTARQ